MFVRQNTEQYLQELEYLVAAIKRYSWNYGSGAIAGVAYSRSQLEVLLEIDRSGPQTVKSLAAHLLVSSGSVTQTVQALLTKNLVTKTADEHDRRIARIMLSQKGTKIVEAYKLNASDNFKKIINELNHDEIGVLFKALSKLVYLADSGDIMSRLIIDER